MAIPKTTTIAISNCLLNNVKYTPMSTTVQDKKVKLRLCARSVEVELHNSKTAIQDNKELKYVVLFREKKLLSCTRLLLIYLKNFILPNVEKVTSSISPH
jgi:hypothetical protein